MIITFAIWGIALVPTWFVVRDVGVKHVDPEKLAAQSAVEADEVKK